MTRYQTEFTSGFSILETIIGMGILVIVSSALYLSYSNTLDIVGSGQFNSVAANLIESEVEIIRNMRYEDIGIVGGIPAGKLEPSKEVILDGISFFIDMTVRNIDDPFDGLASGSPVDPEPADYKLVGLSVSCPDCTGLGVVELTTTIAPRSLENAAKTGSLLIRSVDASGIPVPGATVTIINNNVVPAVNLTDTTDINGELLLSGVATDSAGYRVTVTRAGYSTERTYPPGDAGNPNPTKPDLTIAEEQLTSATFSIDETGGINFNTVDQFCAPVSDIDFLLNGGKRIGVSPDVFKYSIPQQTNGSGALSLTDMEWDAYTSIPTDASYDLAANSVPFPIILDPADAVQVALVMTSKIPNALLVQVVDQSGQPVNDAAVRLTSGSYDVTRTSGRYEWLDTDWNGGQYTNKSGGIRTASSGWLILNPGNPPYATGSYEWLESETADLGTASSSLFTVSWSPASQPPGAGNNSVRLQVAANNDNQTWDYAGPDGTADSYYTTSGTTLPSTLSGKRYVRYRVELRTTDMDESPAVDDINITYRAGCLPGGATLFQGVPGDIYGLSVTKNGFEDFTESDVSVTAPWQEHTVELSP